MPDVTWPQANFNGKWDIIQRQREGRIMEMKKSLGIVNWHLAVSLGVCLLTGCVSQGTQKSQTIAGEAETENTAPRTSKTTASADPVPVAVQQALQVKFPTVRIPEWKVKSQTIYEAEFTLKGIAITVMFDSTGRWLETETAIDPAQVPKAVRDAAAKQFKGYRVIETQSLERWDAQDLIYELHFENAKQLAKAQFSREGTILTQSAKVKP